MKFYKNRDKNEDKNTLKYVKHYKIKCRYIKWRWSSPYHECFLIDGKEKEFEKIKEVA